MLTFLKNGVYTLSILDARNTTLSQSNYSFKLYPMSLI